MSGVDVRFLGTGDAFGSGGRLHSAALVRSAGGSLLVDCGPSTLAALRRAALDPNAVDAIVLTHLHGDHFGGVPFLLMDAHYATGRTRPLLIAGPAGVEAAVARAHEVLFPGSGALPSAVSGRHTRSGATGRPPRRARRRSRRFPCGTRP